MSDRINKGSAFRGSTVSMLACSEWVGANQTGPTLMKLTTICDCQSPDKLYQAFLSLIFFLGGGGGGGGGGA